MKSTTLDWAETDCLERTQTAPDQRSQDIGDQADTLRAALAQSIERVKLEREQIRAARDGIPRLQKRFNSEGNKLWHQLDDWLNGLDAALTDAPEITR